MQSFCCGSYLLHLLYLHAGINAMQGDVVKDPYFFKATWTFVCQASADSEYAEIP